MPINEVKIKLKGYAINAALIDESLLLKNASEFGFIPGRVLCLGLVLVLVCVGLVYLGLFFGGVFGGGFLLFLFFSFVSGFVSFQ